MEECIFCKIVRKEIPSHTIFENEKYIAFLDIFPRVRGHALVIPKIHYRWVYDVPAFGEFWEIAKHIGTILQKKLQSSYISYVTIGNEVPHAHIHILPQEKASLDGFHLTPVIAMDKKEIEQLAKEISG